MSYLIRIATNLLRSEQRRATRWRALFPKVAHERPAPPTTPQRESLGREATEMVGEALAQLPLRYRAPLVLREIEGLSYKEIATALGCREGTVKSRISRARDQLRILLQPYWQGETA